MAELRTEDTDFPTGFWGTHDVNNSLYTRNIKFQEGNSFPIKKERYEQC